MGDAADAAKAMSMYNTLKESKSKIVSGTALATGACNIMAMVFSPWAFCIAAGALALGVAPGVAYQETLLEDIPSLRDVQNELRNSANEMNEKNKRLAGHADSLQAGVDSLAGTEAELSALAEKTGQNIEYLVQLVEEYKKLNEQATAIIEADIHYKIIDVIQKADRDGDLTIDENEIPYLTRMLKFDNRYIFNEELFVSRVRKDPSMSGILANVKDIKREDLPDDQRCFIRNKKKGV